MRAYFVFLLCFVFCAPHLCEAASSVEEQRLADELLTIIKPLGFYPNTAKYIPDGQKAPDNLANIPDDKLTRMIAAYVFARKGDSPFNTPEIKQIV
ncbi:hypothetical protein [Haloferula sargassicola]|uniref:hypothetical protein n=1 Tax=Haloferula sargassicola TaxID=490096 RepID=UPI003365A709